MILVPDYNPDLTVARFSVDFMGNLSVTLNGEHDYY